MMKVHAVKQEPTEDNEENEKSGVVIDSTMEYCRNLGEMLKF